MKNVFLLAVPLVLAAAMFGMGAGLSQAKADAGAVTGTGSMTDDSSAVYTILALPATYHSCYRCMAIETGFKNAKELVAIKNETRFCRMVAGTPEFDHKWAHILPEVTQGKTCVLLMRGSGTQAEILVKLTAPTVEQARSKLKQALKEHGCGELLKKFKERLHPTPVAEPPVNTNVNVNAPEERPTTSIPETPLEPAVTADAGGHAAVALMAVAGCVAAFGAYWHRP